MEWCAIAGFPNYVVSRDGVVRNIKFKRDLAYSDSVRTSNTYKRVTLFIDACVTYKCVCGTKRTAAIVWKELRTHLGKCPVCTNTVKRSNPSILEN